MIVQSSDDIIQSGFTWVTEPDGKLAFSDLRNEVRSRRVPPPTTSINEETIDFGALTEHWNQGLKHQT